MPWPGGPTVTIASTAVSRAGCTQQLAGSRATRTGLTHYITAIRTAVSGPMAARLSRRLTGEAACLTRDCLLPRLGVGNFVAEATADRRGTYSPGPGGSPGHNSRYPMSGSGEIHSRHCWRLMLVVSLSRSISDVAVAGQIRAILSSLVLATRCPSRLNAQVTYGVAGERGADGLAGVGVPHPHRAVFAAREDALPVGADRWPHRRTVGSGGSSASLPATGSYASRDTAEVTPVTRVALTGAMRRFFKAIAHAISNPRVLHHEAEWS